MRDGSEAFFVYTALCAGDTPAGVGPGGWHTIFPPLKPPSFFPAGPGRLSPAFGTRRSFFVWCARLCVVVLPPLLPPLSFGEAQFVAYYPIGKCPIEKYE